MANTNSGVNIVITGDASQAVREADKLSNALGGLKDSSVKISADSSQAVSEAERLSDVVNAVSGTHIEITADSSQAVEEVEKVANTAESIEDAHVKISADASQASEEAEKAVNALSSIGDAHSEITADGSQATDEAERVQGTIDSINGKEVEITLKIPDDWARDLDTAFNGTASRITKHFERAAEQSGNSFKEKFKEVAEAMDNVSTHFESGFGNVLMGIATKIGLLITSMGGLISSALAIGGGFEAQMTSVQVISGATAEELEKLTVKAREMGASLPISAKNAAEAMTLLVQRGTSVKDTLSTVEHVANLAISQGTDMAQATELLGSVLTNFKLKVEQAAEVVTILNNASNQSPLTMSKMQEALKFIGPTAGAMGMQLTEAMAGLEAVISAVGSAEMAGTGFTTVLTKLSTNAEILGVSTQDATGKLRPLAEIFTELVEKGFGLNEAQAVFGTRGKLAAIALAQQSSALKDNEERLKQWGSTQAAVDAKSKTFTNTMAALSSAIEELNIEIFEQIKNESKGAVSGITELTRSFSAWVSETKIAQKILQGFLDGLGFTIPTGADFKKFLNDINVDLLIDKFKNAGSALKDLGSAIVRVKDVIEAPLEFLIEHMEKFAGITFWGWIIDKGLAVPAALLRLGDAFLSLGKSVNFLLGLNLTSITGFFSSLIASLSSPVLWGAAGIAALGTFAVKKISDYKAAQSELEDALNREKKFLAEQANADNSLELDLKLSIKTGFEKLPSSWAKASDELRAQVDADTKAMRESFRENVNQAIENASKKLPEMSNAFSELAKNLSNADLSSLTKALQGNQEVFDSLSAPMKSVVEELYYMDVRAGQASESVGKLLIAWKEFQERQANNGVTKSELLTFGEALNDAIDNLINKVPEEIARFQKFLGENEVELPVNVSLENAKVQLEETSKKLAKQFNIPVEIVNDVIFTRLEKLASSGDKTAQSLRNGFEGAGKTLENFLQTTQDAVEYLNVSPSKFMPALNSLYKNIQKVDPLTGKLTEQFKKAHDALKQWSNVAFDQLSQRIQRLRQAVEGGFIDKSAIEREAKDALQQIKMQVVMDLEPLKNSFKSQSAYYSAVASDVYSKAFEMGGDIFADALRSELQGYSAQSGEAMGRAFVKQAERGLSNVSSTLKINGIDMQTKGSSAQGLNYQSLGTALSDSVKPFISKLEEIGNKQTAAGQNFTSMASSLTPILNKLSGSLDANNSALTKANDAILSLVNALSSQKSSSNDKTYTQFKDYSSEIAQIVKEIQKVSSGLSNMQSISQANVNAVNGVINAVTLVNASVKALEAAMKSQSSDGISIDASKISQAVINGINPLMSKLDAGSTNYQASTASVTKNLSTLQQSLEALKKSADANVNALSSLQSSLSSSSNSSSGSENFSGALAPLINSVQALNATVSNIQNENQNNASAISEITKAIIAVESAIKSMNGATNYDIEINQQGFIVEKKADADMLARSTVSALRSGLGNGSV